MWCKYFSDTSLPKSREDVGLVLLVQGKLCLDISGLYFCLVLHQFCRYCPIDCSRIAPDLLQCMWEWKQTVFLQIYLSASYEGYNNSIYYSIELLGGYKNWSKVSIATVIYREMHIKSFRKRFVFYKRPIKRYNNFQKMTLMCSIFTGPTCFMIMFHSHIHVFWTLINVCMEKKLSF